MYYTDKLGSLRDIFGAEAVELVSDGVVVDGVRFPIIDDVIIVLDPPRYPPALRERLAAQDVPGAEDAADFARDIQSTFGKEWEEFSQILPEHDREFRQYFDVVDIDTLRGKRACDLGCGIGRWTYFLGDKVREVVLVDFSEAIFVARHNLRGMSNALFFMADVTRLPFRSDFADFIYCIGVLHHLPTDALDAVRALRRFAPEMLVYLYSSLDARPAHFRAMLALVTIVRKLIVRIQNPVFRRAFSWFGAVALYLPFVWLGRLLAPFGLSRHVPLFDFYADKSILRIRQDVYDRFFTRIEQRVARRDILRLTDTFTDIVVSDGIPYWHFLCRR